MPRRKKRSVAGFLPFVPPTVTHNDLEAYTTKRKGRTVACIRKSDRLRAAEDMMWPYVLRLKESSWGLPLKRPVRETLKISWPCGESHKQGEPRSDAPDLDNWVKTFNDLCERAGIISCDAHIVEEHLYKAWAEPAGVYVKFEEIIWPRV